MARVLVAGEFSGIVRDAFIAQGHDAWSCDFMPTEVPGPHIIGDYEGVIFSQTWDCLIAHPTCTYMCNSSAKHLYIGKKKTHGIDYQRWANMMASARGFKRLLNAPIKHKCIENPIMLPYPVEVIGRRQDQVIQPWQFGHGESKATCLWLENLPKLVPTDVVSGREQRIWKASPGPNRWRERSRTFTGIAAAMAAQWGPLL